MIDFRRDRLNAKHTVDAIANSQAAFLRFDVNITCAQLHRLNQQFVDKPYDRRSLSTFRKFAKVFLNLLKMLVVPLVMWPE